MGDIAQEFGLDRFPPFHRDRFFLLAVLGGFSFWFIIRVVFPAPLRGVDRIISWGFFSLVIWQPLLEELLFRGILQGELYRRTWGKKHFLGFSTANWMVSILFMGGHVWFQSNPWALAVVIPSLILGFFRDRYLSVYPSIALHIFFNGGFFILVGAQV